MYGLRTTDMSSTKTNKAPLAPSNSHHRSGAAMPVTNSLSAPRIMRTEPSTSALDKLECDMLGPDIPHQHPVVAFKDQPEYSAMAFAPLKSTQPKDSFGVSSHLRASKITYDDLHARFAAADEERTRVSHLMKAAKLEEERDRVSSLIAAELLAKAESRELYARRLRESVAHLDRSHPRGGDEMLRLTASSNEEQQQGDGAVELDCGHGSATTDIFNGSDASEGVVSPVVQSPQFPSPLAPTEQQSPEPHVSKNNNYLTEKDTLAEPAQWQPHAISQLTPLPTSANPETFTWEQLHAALGGAQYSPGLYFARNSSSSKVLEGRTYWLLEAQYEPFAPTAPGEHGAKLTAFFNDSLTPDGTALDEEDYSNVPVFICLNQGEGYHYLGQYSQKRYSDKLSHSELFKHVPNHVLTYWASQLASPHRPAWITEALINHFWPAPTYTGPIPSDSAVSTPATGVTEPQDPERILEKRVQRALERYAVELKDWKKEARIKATLLTEEALMDMWEKSDMDEEKGLRLWWEYLECVGFDIQFYEKLVALNKKAQRVSGKAKVVLSAPIVHSNVDSKGPRKTENKQSRLAVNSNSTVNKNHKQRHDSVTASNDSTVKETTSTRLAAKRPADLTIPPPVFPQADLRAAREMHDKATKAGDRPRGRSEKPRMR